MDRIQFIQYKGKSILLVDLNGIRTGDTELITKVISDSSEIIRNNDNLESGIRVLTDITNAEVDLKGISLMAAYVEGNKPYVKASALVGSSDSLDIVKNVIEKETDREFKSGFLTRNQACDWLVKQ